MRRHITLLAALALAVSMGCATGATGGHGRMGAAAAPIATPGQQINFDPTVSPGLTAAINTTVFDSGGAYSWLKYGVANTAWRPVPMSTIVTTDPSQSPGLKAAIGFRVSLADGTAAWVKSGTGDTAWSTDPSSGGGGLSSVTTDSTLAGNGTLGSPLGVNPVAARAPDWFAYMAVVFQENGGISPLAFSCMIMKDFADNGLTTSQQGMQSAGTGAGTVYTNIPGGVIKATGATSGAGYADYASAPQSQSPWSFLPNLRTKRWMAAYRLAIGKTPTSASSFSVGVFDAGNAYIGLGYSGAQTNWQYTRGAAPTNLADTGKAITVDATGATGYLTMAVANFDLSHVSYNVDVLSNPAFTNAELVTNLPNNSGFPYIYNEGVAAGDIYFLDKVIVCGEM